MQIRFSHIYPKLHKQKKAELVAVKTCNRSDLSKMFIEYDTLYLDSFGAAFYPLLDGQYMILLFLGEENIPFTTVRRFTEEKHYYYKMNIGKTFDIVIKPEM